MSKGRSIERIFLVILFFLTVHQAFAGGGNEDKGGSSDSDTTQAIVLYGHKFLFDPGKFRDDNELINYLDSLLGAPEISMQLISEISLFMTIRKKDDECIRTMIDSLFDLEVVPYALINQINYYVATRDLAAGENGHPGYSVTSYFTEHRHQGIAFFEGWDTERSHPWYNPLHDPDSSVTLVLADSLSFCSYRPPVNGTVTSGYGWRDGRPHNGIDLDLNTGDPVLSAFDGIVRIAGRHGGYGNLVVVRHHNGLETYYAHLHRIKVKAGQSVEAGQLLGSGGNTGNSTGSHLHFEVRFRGNPINPKHIISFTENRLHSESVVVTRSSTRYSAYPEGTEFHKVERGESLSLIASRYGLSITRLCELNAINRRSTIRPGQKLRVS